MMSLMVSYLCCPFPHEKSWMRSGTELSQFLRIFLPALTNIIIMKLDVVFHSPDFI